MTTHPTRELWSRLAVSALVLPLLYLAVRYGSRELFLVLVAVVVLVGQVEFYRMAFAGRFPPEAAVTMAAGAAAVIGVVFWDPLNLKIFLSSGVIAFLLFLLGSKGNAFQVLGKGATLVVGVLYLGWLPAHLVLLRDLGDGARLVVFLLTVTWGVDSGAYAVGRTWGRTPLAPRVSPHKTVEGAVGGLLAGMLIAWAAGRWFFPFFSSWDIVFLGVGLGIAGQLGDLVESRFKRSAGVKDSSRLFPSHGGLLDKADSLMFNAPFLYYSMVLVIHHGAAPLIRV